MEPPLPCAPSAQGAIDMFRGLIQPDGLRLLPVHDCFYRSSVIQHPGLASFLELCSRNHAELLATIVHRALAKAATPGSELVQAGAPFRLPI